MKTKMIVVSITILMAIIVTSAVTMAFSPKKNLKPSEYDIGTTYAVATKDKKPFILIFYSDYCSYCVQSMPKYLTIADAYKGKYNIVMTNTDNATPEVIDIANRYALNGLPSMYIIDPTIDNMVYINNSIYGDLQRIRVELDRYLRIRSMIKE